MTVKEFIEQKKAEEKMFSVSVNMGSPDVEVAVFGNGSTDDLLRVSLLNKYGSKEIKDKKEIYGGKFGTTYHLKTR